MSGSAPQQGLLAPPSPAGDRRRSVSGSLGLDKKKKNKALTLDLPTDSSDEMSKGFSMCVGGRRATMPIGCWC